VDKDDCHVNEIGGITFKSIRMAKLAITEHLKWF
jgi:hypothetical protein